MFSLHSTVQKVDYLSCISLFPFYGILQFLDAQLMITGYERGKKSKIKLLFWRHWLTLYKVTFQVTIDCLQAERNTKMDMYLAIRGSREIDLSWYRGIIIYYLLSIRKGITTFSSFEPAFQVHVATTCCL